LRRAPAFDVATAVAALRAAGFLAGFAAVALFLAAAFCEPAFLAPSFLAGSVVAFARAGFGCSTAAAA